MLRRDFIISVGTMSISCSISTERVSRSWISTSALPNPFMKCDDFDLSRVRLFSFSNEAFPTDIYIVGPVTGMLRLFSGYLAVWLRLCFPVLAMIRFLSAVSFPRKRCATFSFFWLVITHTRFHFVRSFIAVVVRNSCGGLDCDSADWLGMEPRFLNPHTQRTDIHGIHTCKKNVNILTPELVLQ